MTGVAGAAGGMQTRVQAQSVAATQMMGQRTMGPQTAQMRPQMAGMQRPQMTNAQGAQMMMRNGYKPAGYGRPEGDFEERDKLASDVAKAPPQVRIRPSSKHISYFNHSLRSKSKSLASASTRRYRRFWRTAITRNPALIVICAVTEKSLACCLRWTIPSFSCCSKITICSPPRCDTFRYIHSICMKNILTGHRGRTCAAG